MCYEKNFYIKANITGYTLDPDDSHAEPTVYFRAGNKFGRITQKHNKPDNIGRNKVREKPDYTIQNRGGKAEEYYDGAVQHSSRGEYISLSEVKEDRRSSVLDKLAEAIPAHENIKPKYSKK